MMNKLMVGLQIVDCILHKMPCCMTWFGGHIPVYTALGSVEYDPSGKNITKVFSCHFSLE
jgi:hypothetical protein